jgi:apoptotic chromatin condensation inducer in the nucleus
VAFSVNYHFWISDDDLKTVIALTSPFFHQYETSEEANAAYKNIDNTVFPPDTGRTLHVGALSESKAEEMIVLEKEAVEKRIKFDWELAIQEQPNVIAPPAVSDEPKATEETASPGARKSRLGGIEQVSRQLQRAAADTEKSSSDIMRRQPVEALTTASLRANTVKVLSLDELFKKTKTLPALYYQPVSEEIASKRLEHMHSYSAVNN